MTASRPCSLCIKLQIRERPCAHERARERCEEVNLPNSLRGGTALAGRYATGNGNVTEKDNTLDFRSVKLGDKECHGTGVFIN